MHVEKLKSERAAGCSWAVFHGNLWSAEAEGERLPWQVAAVPASARGARTPT